MSFKLPSINELNNTQKTIISLLSKIIKLAVIGGPGTGKTIIGIHAAGLMADSKKKCLFLSYSTSLRDFIKSVARDFKLNINNIEINSYHSWFWRELKSLGFDDPTTFQDMPYHYDVEKVGRALSVIPTSKKKKYDYIFVDEAQDVQDGLIKYFAQFTNNILVTYDDSQKIGFDEQDDNVPSYDHSNILIDLQIGDRFYDLIDNYRNTTQIEMVAKILLSSYDLNEVSLQKVTSHTDGPLPRLIKLENNDVDKICSYIVNHYDKSKSVGVFIGNDNRDIGRSNFDLLKDRLQKLCKEQGIQFMYKYGSRNTNINSFNALSNGIFLMTVKNSKGLEFDETYVFSSNSSIKNYQGKNAFYVAFTRAKTRTNIVMNIAEHANELNELLLNNAFMFETKSL